ncbi:MAG: hypothetical protein GY719_07830 [bacterium]|nr:hypothetical protein [bacterium]
MEESAERAFAERATGFLTSGVPDTGPIETAVSAYEQALAQDPDNLRLLYKLMDALYFHAYHVAQDKEDQREIYERLVELAARAIELVAKKAGRDKDGLSSLTAEERAEALRGVPEAAEAHYWVVASWGLWGMTHSKLAAVRKGVASKVRDNARMIILLDERFGDAAGLRMLGRLYTEAPRVPFFTYWIDRREGLDMLRRAAETSRHDPRNLFFLAEAILEYDEDSSDQALELLREIVRRGPHPDELVEHSETVELARELLAELEEDR